MTATLPRVSFWTRAAGTVRGTAVRGAVSAVLASAFALPASAQVLAGDGSVPCGKAYVVESGDTLSMISERAYGDPQLYGFIADANWDALGGNLENVSVGMSLAIPCVDASGGVMTDEQQAEQAESLGDVVAVEGALTPDEMDVLFGPVALLPDQVLTPLLVGVTFPLDVVKAARFVEENSTLSDEERAAQAVDQPWDSSVRELTAGFPDLVTRMSEHVDWTEQAGEAVVAQTDDVLGSIQRLRQTAIDNGYLVTNDAQVVEKQGDTIVINPATPGVVYVPVYDSQVVYSTPVVGTPEYHYGYGNYQDDGWGDVIIGGGILLGTAIILDEIFDDDWDGWDHDDKIDWDRGDITIDRGDINIDRGDINIGNGEINIGDGNRPGIGDGDRPQIGDGDRPQIGDGDRPQIGDGDRPQIGDGDRPQIGDGDRISIGDSDRPQVDRGDLGTIREGIADGDRPRADTLPADRASISNAATREAARAKIETRKSTGAKPAKLGNSQLSKSRPSAAQSSATKRAASLNRPSTKRAPAARAPSRTNTFKRPSGGNRAAATASRGRASMGGHGGGRRGGGRR
ncbi:DUF3300 domain-containing protein [Fluviibacterium sp. S390]|uniref:DUF3300 domain-containing protein n=1 Tax=Fluviibacterium sp. S390 TaxID=3415139 RepID=UPI003C7B09A2